MVAVSSKVVWLTLFLDLATQKGKELLGLRMEGMQKKASLRSSTEKYLEVPGTWDRRVYGFRDCGVDGNHSLVDHP